jgi:hypothetical protein
MFAFAVYLPGSLHASVVTGGKFDEIVSEAYDEIFRDDGEEKMIRAIKIIKVTTLQPGCISSSGEQPQ